MTQIANKTQTGPFNAPLDPTPESVHCFQLSKCVCFVLPHVFGVNPDLLLSLSAELLCYFVFV